MRGWILLAASLLFIAAGLSTLTLPYPPEVVATDPSIKAHLLVFRNSDIIGAVFLGAGVIGLLAGLRPRWAVRGFMVMQFLATFWVLLYMLSWAQTGAWRAIFPALQYASVAGVLAAASKIVELPKRRI